MKNLTLKYIKGVINDKFGLTTFRLKAQYPARTCLSVQVKEKKMEIQPKISIVIPSLNQGRFLESTIKSIIGQNYSNYELIIIDGGSDDDSVEIIKRYSNKVKYWISESDSGQTNAINKGFKHATGDILAWLNADDCYLPNTLNNIAYYLSDGIDVVYGNRLLVNEEGQDIGQWILPYHSNGVLSVADFIPQETLFWKREIWEKVGSNLDESFCFAMDWDLLLRFKAYGAKFRHIDVILGMFRLHDLQKSQSQIDSLGTNEMNILRTRELERKSYRLRLIRDIYYKSVLLVFLIFARLFAIKTA